MSDVPGRPTRTGLLLAGGRSTRFGESDKALADLAGAPLVCHVAAALAPTIDELVVNCRADQRAALADALAGLDDRLPVRFAVDPVPDEGPVAGLLTGLRVARGRRVAVAGCDQPFLRTATVATLFDRATDEGASGGSGADPGSDGAVALVDGRRQPLPAVYRATVAREAAERTLATGSRALRDVLTRVDPVPVPVAPGAVRDIDTRGDFPDEQAEQTDRNADSTVTMEITDELAARRTNGAATDSDDDSASDSEPNAVPVPDGGEEASSEPRGGAGWTDGGDSR